MQGYSKSVNKQTSFITPGMMNGTTATWEMKEIINSTMIEMKINTKNIFT